MTYVNRIIELPKNYSFFLFGPRQVGKSSIIQHRFPDESTMIFNLLDYALLRQLTRNPQSFKESIDSRSKKISHVIVDEVQKLPWILDEVHRIIETSKNPPFFILTGSSARKLKKSGVNMLGGRAIEKFLFPLTYIELKQNPYKEFCLNQVLERGSLPLVYLSDSEKLAKQILKAYVNTYIKEEIKEEALVRNLDAFSDFLLFASEENGNLLNYANIASDVGVSANTIKEYYRILEDTLMGFTLQPIKKSIRQRITKSPKFYFFDTGIPRALSEKLSTPLIKATKDYGRAFEHWLIKEIIHSSRTLDLDYKFSFYRVDENIEVDLIIEKPNGEILAIEIKSKNNLQVKDLKGLKSFAEIFPKAKLICASQITHPITYGEIRVLPWNQVLDEIIRD
jgi:predicted AAA+ superfamily ATPase